MLEEVVLSNTVQNTTIMPLVWHVKIVILTSGMMHEGIFGATIKND